MLAHHGHQVCSKHSYTLSHPVGSGLLCGRGVSVGGYICTYMCVSGAFAHICGGQRAASGVVPEYFPLALLTWDSPVG